MLLTLFVECCLLLTCSDSLSNQPKRVSSKSLRRSNQPRRSYGGRFSSLGRSHRDVRESPTRECNSLLSTFTRVELLHSYEIYLRELLPDDEEEIHNTMALLESSIKYGAHVYKVCSSCQDLEEQGVDELDGLCDDSTYGYDAQHSSLVMLPADEHSQIVTGQLRGVMQFHGTCVSLDRVPTESWSKDGLTSADQAVVANHVSTYMASITAAGTGVIGIMPDYIGYGSSARTHNRTYFFIPSYQQASVIAWKATQLWVKRLSDGFTQLVDVATVSGRSEGGFASIAGAAALDKLGVRVLKVFALVPLIAVDEEFAFIATSYDEGLVNSSSDNKCFQAMVPYALFAFSAETYGVANTGSGQIAASPEWTIPGDFDHNLIAWFECPSPLTEEQIVQKEAVFVPDMIAPGFLAALHQARASDSPKPCEPEFVTDDVTNKLCDAFTAASIRSLLASTGIPTGICYSSGDTVISPSQFTSDLFSNPFVHQLRGTQDTEITGDHHEAGFRCAYTVLDFLAGEGRPPHNSNDSPSQITPVDSNFGALPPASSVAADSPSKNNHDASDTSDWWWVMCGVVITTFCLVVVLVRANHRRSKFSSHELVVA